MNGVSPETLSQSTQQVLADAVGMVRFGSSHDIQLGVIDTRSGEDVTKQDIREVILRTEFLCKTLGVDTVSWQSALEAGYVNGIAWSKDEVEQTRKVDGRLGRVVLRAAELSLPTEGGDDYGDMSMALAFGTNQDDRVIVSAYGNFWTESTDLGDIHYSMTFEARIVKKQK